MNRGIASLLSLAVVLAFCSFSPALAGSVEYIYDDAGRLMKAKYENGPVIEYTYDNAGNLLPRKVVESNEAPVVPGAPTGRGRGKKGIVYKFTGSASDPDGDPVKYRFNWGDGARSRWSSRSSLRHKWSEPGAYCVKVLARDDNGALSGWSPCKDVVITSRPPLLAGPPTGASRGKTGVRYGCNQK